MLEVTERLAKLVGINSVFPEEGRIGEYLDVELRRLGFSTKRQYIGKNRFNIFAERGRGRQALLFYGHMDTVPAYGRRNRQLKLTRRHGRLYGLGSCDMKGGIAALLDALSWTERERRVKVLLGVDEENLSEGAWKAVSKKSDWFDDVNLGVSCEAAVSASTSGGANVVTVGRRGRAVVEIEIQGVSAHGAAPEKGINALDEAAAIASSVASFELGSAPGFGKETVFVSKIDGMATSLSVPDIAHVELDVQMVPPNRNRGAVRNTVAFIDSLRARKRINRKTGIRVRMRPRSTTYIEPYVNNLNDIRIRRLLGIVKSASGNVELGYGSSTADENIIANELGIPMVVIGPEGGNEHSKDEWVSEHSLTELSLVYSRLIGEFE